MPHKFKVGQRVRPAGRGPAGRDGLGQTFEVLRLMPEDRAGEPCYRIRTNAGERAMQESELVPVGVG